jgi:hypothetical protein
MRTMSQMVGASYRCRGISGANERTAGLQAWRPGVPVLSLRALRLPPRPTQVRGWRLSRVAADDGLGYRKTGFPRAETGGPKSAPSG